MQSIQYGRRMTLNYVRLSGSLLTAPLQSNTGHTKAIVMFRRKTENYIPVMSLETYTIFSNMITLKKQDMDMQTYLGKLQTSI